jgi:hypothetical protein
MPRCPYFRRPSSCGSPGASVRQVFGSGPPLLLVSLALLAYYLGQTRAAYVASHLPHGFDKASLASIKSPVTAMNALSSIRHPAILFAAFPAAFLSTMLMLAACDSSRSAQKRPNLKVSTQTVEGRSTVVEGDTVIFRPVDSGNAPCHFFKPSCNLPPIPIEGFAGSIRLQ